jgi:hypothetical protein
MAFEIRYTLNRASVILKPRQPVIDWLNSVDDLLDLPRRLAIDPLNEHGDIFLIPDSELVESREQAVAWIEKRWRDFFEFELNQWIIDDTLWPQKLTLKLFREWFDVEYRSMVWDLGQEPLTHEDWLDE